MAWNTPAISMSAPANVARPMAQPLVVLGEPVVIRTSFLVEGSEPIFPPVVLPFITRAG